MHFDTLMWGVVARFVPERPEVEIRAQLTVDARKKVQLNAAVTPRGSS